MYVLLQFNCTDSCPEYAQYKYTKEIDNGEKIILCVATDYNALGYVLSICNAVIIFYWSKSAG